MLLCLVKHACAKPVKWGYKVSKEVHNWNFKLTIEIYTRSRADVGCKTSGCRRNNINSIRIQIREGYIALQGQHNKIKHHFCSARTLRLLPNIMVHGRW